LLFYVKYDNITVPLFSAPKLRSDIVLKIQEGWKHENNECLSKNVDYMEIDFFGPFVTFKVEKNPLKGNVRVYPIKSFFETAEFKKSEFDLLVLATKELYEEFGEFTLILPLIKQEVIIKTSTSTEEVFISILKGLRLFWN